MTDSIRSVVNNNSIQNVLYDFYQKSHIPSIVGSKWPILVQSFMSKAGISINSFWMHIIDASKPGPTSSEAIVHSYFSPQFCCNTIIGNLWYCLYFQGSSSLEKTLGLGSRRIFLIYLFFARLAEGFSFFVYQLWVL